MTSFSFVGLRRVWFALSGAMIVGSLIALATLGLKFGVDFTGGSLIELSFASSRPANPAIVESLAHAGFEGAVVQPAGDAAAIIRLRSLSEEEHQKALGALRTSF